MNTYYFPVERAAWLFPVAAFAFTLPYILYSYRKFGSVSVLRTLILVSMLFYLQCAYFLIILPLPDPAAVATRTGPFWDLTPLHFLWDILAKSGFDISRPDTWRAAFVGYAREPLFNLCLTVPFGVYLAYYFKKNLKKVLLFSFCLSLFFEISQLTGLFWLYPKPYRLFSVDDLLLNTLGGGAGYFLYARFLRFLPGREKMDRKSAEKSARVGFFRRAAALAIDAAIVSALRTLLVVFCRLDGAWAFAAALFGYYMGTAALFRGKSAGKALVRIQVAAVAGRAFLPGALLRYLLLNAMWVAFQTANAAVGSMDPRAQYIPVLAQALLLAIAAADLLWSLRKEKRLWYERLSGTQNVSFWVRRP
jgi:glycopeptide antibiotics resistance protein